MTALRGSEPDDIYLALVPALDTRQPNFRSAGWRAVEAAECLKKIVEAIPSLPAEWKGYPAVRALRSTPDQHEVSLIDWEWSHLPTARKITMLASEVLHHARIALDYCAYHMVWKDGGVPRDGTHSPLLKDPVEWNKGEAESSAWHHGRTCQLGSRRAAVQLRALVCSPIRTKQQRQAPTGRRRSSNLPVSSG